MTKKPTRRPSKDEMDERVTLPLPPDRAIKAILETGPHPDNEDAEKD